MTARDDLQAGFVTIDGRRMFRPSSASSPGTASWATRLQVIGLVVLVIAAVVNLSAGKANGDALVSLGVVLALVALSLLGGMLRRRHRPPTEPVVVDDALVHEVRALDARGQRVAAVRLMRERTGLGLRDAVVAVDTLVHDAAAS